MTMKTKIISAFQLVSISAFLLALPASAQFKAGADSLYYFPQFTTGPLSTGNTWLVLNQGGTNGYNLNGTNALRFLNEITPSAYKLVTIDQMNTASNSLVVQIEAAGGLSFTPQYGTLNLSNWSTLSTNILSGLGGGSSAWADITGKPTTIAGYGITDYNSLGDARWQPLDTELTAWAALATSAKQDADADLTDLADGSLTGSKVGTGINGDNITSGTVADARVASTIARDSEVTTAVAITASGFDGNLATTDDTIQEVAQKVDDLVLGGSSDYDTNTFTGTGPLVRATNAVLHTPTFTGGVTADVLNVPLLRSTTAGNTNVIAAWGATGNSTNVQLGASLSYDPPTRTLAVALDASGFNRNLATTDDTVQEVAQKLDDFPPVNFCVGGSVATTYSSGFTRFVFPWGGTAIGTVASVAQMRIATPSGRNLRVSKFNWFSSGSIGSGTNMVFALGTNGVASNLSITVPSGISTSNSTETVTVTNGSYFTIIITGNNASTSASGTHGWMFNVEEVSTP